LVSFHLYDYLWCFAFSRVKNNRGLRPTPAGRTATAVRIASELELASAETSPQQTSGCGGDNEQSDKLLPIHRSEHSPDVLERKRNLRELQVAG
jgi:hypothetical protein